MAVVWILTHFVSRSPALMLELRVLWRLLEQHDISLHPVYIRSAENRIADAASRLVCSRDYVLVRACFELLQHRWGWCTVDAFASAATAQLPRYWAAHRESGGEAVDALAQDWSGERLWLHPPPGLLPRVVQMLEQSSYDAAQMCVPHWTGAPWFGMLQALSAESITLPAGSLRRVAADAPTRLHSRPVAVFLIASRNVMP